MFPLVSLFAETPGLDELDLGVRGWVKRLKGPLETDAVFLVRRLATLGRDAFENEWAYEGLELPLVLAPGKGGPSRTQAAIPVPAVAFQTAPLDSGRPDVAREVALPPLRVVPARGDEAGRLLDLARESMVTRERDLDVFQWGDRRDVRLAHFPDGLTFVVIGALPERRLLLESVYGFLTLKNGVPVGYVLVSALFGSSEIAYNVFETFRGGESGRIYGKVLALTRHLFGPDVFTIFPYQLGGYGNPEALSSGAWWFYQKLGFRPRAPHVVALMNEELVRMKEDPKHRSSLATLKVLASENLYFHLGKERDDAIGLLELPNVGLRGDGHAGAALRLGPRARRSRPDPRGARSPRPPVPLRMELGRAPRLPALGPSRHDPAGARALVRGRKARPRRGRESQGRPARVGLRAPLRPPPEAASGDRGARAERAGLTAQPGERFA